MRCPKCGNKSSRVVDSRSGVRSRRRRRQCTKCKDRFTTTEIYGIPRGNSDLLPLFPVEVQKRDGNTQRLDESKLRNSVEYSCSRRGISSADVNSMIAEIIDRIRSDAEPVRVDRIVDFVCAELIRHDKLAAQRYAYQHLELINLDQVERYIAKLSK